MAQNSLPNSEREALRELERLGDSEIFGESIQDLLRIASLREQALEQLREAETAFDKGVSSNDRPGIKRVFTKLSEAIKNLRDVEYPTGEAFELRRRALNADIARAKALVDTIEMWWWGCFTECVAEFNGSMSLLSDERALSEMRQSLQKAKTILESWPSGEGESKWQSRAKTSSGKMEEKLKETEESYLTTRLETAKYWLDRAKDYLPPLPDLEKSATEGEQMASKSSDQRHPSYRVPSVSGTVPEEDVLKSQSPASGESPSEVSGRANGQSASSDPFAAFTCLARAEVILSGVERDGRGCSNYVWGSLQPEVGGAKSCLEDLETRSQQFLPEWLSEQRRNRIQKLQGLLEDKWQQCQAGEDAKGAAEFLAGEDKTRRDLVDQIRLYLYQSPAIKTESWLQELMLTRQDNLLRARQLLRDVQAHWSQQDESGHRPYTYWAWHRIDEAQLCDPDDEEVKRLHEMVDGAWNDLNEKFNVAIREVDAHLSKIDGQTAESASRTGSEPGRQHVTKEAGEKTFRAAWLVVEKGPPPSRPSYLLDPLKETEIAVGRSKECHFVLPGARVSRDHARIYWKGDGWELKDISTYRTTYVNGKRITGPYRLRIGDRVTMGETTFVVGQGVAVDLHLGRIALDRAREVWREQVERPPEWDRRIQETSSRLNSLEEAYERSQELADRWLVPDIDDKEVKGLVNATQALVSTLPANVHSILETTLIPSLERARDTYRSPSQVLDITELVRELKQR